MDEFNLTDLFRYYLKKLPIVLIVLVVITILGLIYIYKIKVPMYHGTTSIILVQSSESTTTLQNELTINEKLLATYSEIIKSRRVLSEVIKDLKLDYTVNEMAKKIDVASETNSQIIRITVSDENNIKASKIANKIAEIFSKEVDSIYNLENISILDKAIVEKKPYNINTIKQMLIYISLGLIISSFIIFIMYYFNDTINSKKDIETRIKLPVIGEIPLYNKKNEEYHIKNTKNNLYDSVDQTIEPNKRGEEHE